MAADPERPASAAAAPAGGVRTASAPPPASPAATRPVVSFPDPESGPAQEIWDEFFAANQPRPADVRRHILKLHNESRHEHVAEAIRAALIHGQSQPWMYEVLALTMEIQKEPAEEIERVVLSMTDFGGADYDSMLYSAAYLVRFNRQASALKMFRQASRVAPERPEPYILAFEHATRLQSTDDILWTAGGVLLFDWGKDHVARHRAANDALLNLERTLTRQDDEAALATARKAMAEARQRDLVVELVWSGTGDLDLEVEEPGGGVCSIAEAITASGGYLLNDGFGPKPEDCRETYVCALAMAGDYRVVVKHRWGQIVGNRATLTLTTRQGTPDERVERRAVVLEGGVASTQFTLEEGRRTVLRTVAGLEPQRVAAGAGRPGRRPGRTAEAIQAAAEFSASRGGRVGAVGFQPVVQTFVDGAQLGASAIISADRRYVRLGISPMFSNITDVFTFSFYGGAGGQQGQQGGNNPQGNGGAP
ncbi:MAG: hypothetical protein KF774_21280 [Planctomyces sp.]|nr:hypothetical protein [Planctomyces sp.]